MTIFFPLLLLLQSAAPLPADLDQQIQTYFQNIERDEYRSESLWSLAQIYMENDRYRESFFETGDALEVDWINILDRDSSDSAGFHELSLLFRDELLHLYLQLQVFRPEERELYFREFYSESGSTEFKELNRQIAGNGTVRLNDLETENWNFAIFLILFYPEQVELPDTDFHEIISQDLLEIISENAGGSFRDDFLYASLLQSLFDADIFFPVLDRYEDLKDLKNIPETRTKLSLYWALDFVLYRTGHLNKSLEIQRRHTIPLSRYIGDNTSLNAILAAHGANLYSIGRYHEAGEVFNTALSDTQNLTSTIKTRLLNNLSLVYYKLGESNLYIETQLQALDFAIEQESYSHQLNIYRNLHIYYRKNRNWDLALQYIEAAREIAEETENRNELASIIISQSVYYDRFLNNSDAAFALLSEAKELLEGSSNYRLHVRTLYEEAQLYENAKNYERSREIYNEVIAISSENSNNRIYLEALVDLANIEIVLGNHDKAGELIREFNIHDVAVVDFFVLVNARRIEAEVAFGEKKYSEAENLITMVYRQVLERAQNTTDLEAGYWHIEQAYLQLFQLYAELLLEQDRVGDLLNVLDQFKTINDATLVSNPLVNADILTEEELTENHQITEHLNDLRKQLLIADERSRLLLQNEISALNARKNQLSHQHTSPDLFGTVNIWTIQSRLNSREMVLHTTRILDQLYLIRIDNREVNFQKLPFSRDQEILFEESITGLTSGSTNLENLYEIYHYLGFSSLPSRINSLIIIPDSYLYQLPLDVLPVSRPDSPISYGSAEYLIEKMEIRYLNNMKDFVSREPRRLHELDFTGIGISDFQQTGDGQLISLPEAVHEVESIVSRLYRSGKTNTLLESQGTVSAFRTSAANSKILHLASHSMISESDPLFSRIYLHPESGEDGANAGELFAYQLFDMNLRNDLIMLNSCESGSGEYFQGAGVMGISRALRYAGAKSLILNSWSVNDRFASDFAVEFYTHINSGKSKSYSLREAKIHFLSNKNANPHYWGAYMLNGNSEPLFDKPGEKRTYAFLMVLFAAVVILTHLRLTNIPSKA